MGFTEWLRSQYGPGGKYPSARQFGLAISKGKNDSIIGYLEQRGISRFETAERLAEATDTPLIEVLIIAGLVSPADVTGRLLSPDEAKLVDGYRSLPQQYRRVLLAVLGGFLEPGDEEDGL